MLLLIYLAMSFFFFKDILLIQLSFIKCLSVLDFVFIFVIEISCQIDQMIYLSNLATVSKISTKLDGTSELQTQIKVLAILGSRVTQLLDSGESGLAQPTWARRGAAAFRALNYSLNLLSSKKERLLICANKWNTWTLSLHILFHQTSETLSCVIFQGCRLFLSILVTSPRPHLTHHRAQPQLVSSGKKWQYLIFLAQTTALPVLPQLNSAYFLLLQCTVQTEVFFNCVYFQFLRNFLCPLKKMTYICFSFLDFAS